MRAFTPIVVAVFVASLAAAYNPADLSNCPPKGGADKCSKETTCNDRIRINYSLPTKGHRIWYLSDYDPDSIPQGIELTVDNVGTCN